MKRILFRRLYSCSIDFLLVLFYAALLLLFSLMIQAQGRLSNVLTPVNGQIVGFLTLTVPVFLYFFLSEAGRKELRWEKASIRYGSTHLMNLA